jgi:hypothetical protein
VPYFEKMTTLRDEMLLLALVALGGTNYLASIWVLLGRKWLRGLLGGAEPTAKP